MLKAALYKCVLGSDLKWRSVSESTVTFGFEVQFLELINRFLSLWTKEESSSAILGDAKPGRASKVIQIILKSILQVTGNQCKDAKPHQRNNF